MKRTAKSLTIILLLASILTAQDKGIPLQHKPIIHKKLEHRLNRIEKLRAIRIWKMTEYLNLTEDQSTKFFPRYNEFEKKLREKHREKRELLNEIDKIIQEKGGKITEREVKKYTDRLRQINQEILEMKIKFVSESSDILTPEQQMRCLIFDDKFRNQMMKILSERELETKIKEEDKQ